MSGKLYAVALLGALLLAGCAAVGPDYREPQVVALPAAYANAAAPAAPAAIDPRWWGGFGDPELSALVDRALAANHDLRIAVARLAEARAFRSELGYDRYPTVTAAASYARSRSSGATTLPGQPRDIDLYTAGFDARWELDFFGVVRRSLEAGSAAEESAAAGVRDAQLSVVAEVARNYFDLRGFQSRLAVAQQNAENQKQTLALTRDLLDGGRGNALDVARAEAQYRDTLASLPQLEAAAKRAIYRLGVLTGQPPAAFEAELSSAAPPTALPVLRGIGAPNDLLRRRPDIRVAERDLAAATARIGVVTADLYPRVIIGGDLGSEALRAGDLGRRDTTFWSVVPRISWAFLDVGRVKARIRQADARAAESLARFERTVLVALEETENALTAFDREQVRRGELEAAAAASEQAAELARQRFRGGVANFLDVLQAESQQLAAQDRLADSRATTATSMVAVYKALGGGWETPGQ